MHLIIKKPIAEDDSSDTDQGVEIEIDVLSNDSDPDGDELTIFDLDYPRKI